MVAVEAIRPTLPRFAQIRGRPHAWNFLTRSWVNISALNIREGEWGPQPYLGDEPLPRGVVLAVGMSRGGISSEANFADEEPVEEKEKEQVDKKEIKKLAEQLHRKGGGELRDWMGEAHRRLLDEHLIRAGFTNPPTIYEYGDGKGKTLYQVYRYDHPLFKKAKQLPIRHKAKDGTLVPGPGLLRVPFRLDLFENDGELLYVEGEGKVQRLAELGWKATTMAGQKWSVEAAYKFTGQDVIIIPDNDDAGRRNAEKAAKLLKGYARSIRIVKLPGLGRSEDIIDWLDKGHTADVLKALIDAARPTKGICLEQMEWLDPSTIPERECLYTFNYVRGYVGLTLASGNVGKSIHTIAEALAMVSGKALLGPKPVSALRVWYWNGEDPKDELKRRFGGAQSHYKLAKEDIDTRLFVNSGRDMPFVIAEEEARKVRLNEDVIDEITEELRKNKIDVAIIDPFVTTHRVNENDNMAIDLVAKAWSRIADELNIAVMIVHHTRKANGNEMSTDDGRGASALPNAARSTRTLNAMTKEDANKAGVDDIERRRYFSSYNGRLTMAPPTEVRDWFYITSVHLGNGKDGFGEGDGVGVVTRWQFPKAEAKTVTGEMVREALARIAAGSWRADHRATDWVGRVIGEVVGYDPDNALDRAAIKKILTQWTKERWIRTVTRNEPKSRKDKVYVEVAPDDNKPRRASSETGAGFSEQDSPGEA